MWTRRGDRDWSASGRASRDDFGRCRYCAEVDDEDIIEDCETLSPNTARRKIAELESRIAELTSSSEAVLRRLGRAERSLRDIDLNKADDYQATVRRRSRRDDVALSDDDDVDVRQRHSYSRHREELRREIARLREDVRLLRHGSTPRARHVYDLLDDHDDQLTDCQSHAPAADYISRRTPPDAGRYRPLSPTSCSGTGARSIVHRPINTQRNKYRLHSSTARQRNVFHTFDVSGKRAYKPHTAGDLNIGDVVKVRRAGGRIEVAQVYYIGHLPGKSEPFIGVELEHATGNHDGMYDGFRYFECKPNRGLFVAFDQVVMAWGSF